MGLDKIKCFNCQQYGHLERDCPGKTYAAEINDTRPQHCGICDPRTRLVTIDLAAGTVRRCPDCHPSARKTLPQHRRCPQCQVIAYSWDTSPCGMHEGPQTPDRRLPAGRIREITGSNS